MELSLDEIARALGRLYPELDVGDVRPLATGFGSIAVETADGVVFRIPRWEGPANGQATELRALPFLAGRLPVAIPDPRWRIEPGDPALPLGAMGYRKLAGVTPAPGRIRMDVLAGDLGAFFDALHGVPVTEAEKVGLTPWVPPLEGFQRQRDSVLEPLRGALTAAEYRRVVRWWDALLADDTMVEFEPAVRHGDPWYGNLLVDPATGRLAAVLDWEGVEIGDPAWDFAAQLDLADELFRRTIEAYSRRNPALVRRARILFEVRQFGGVRLARELGDETELVDAVAKLRAGSILAGR